ncbi:hypothetical protein [Planobispora takensis]|uniref:Uncharacterized protein n=1 Tax=Planobispora takensis TaxID=1367882 RepID=A0A8J3T122_9ACTN|nr:hypothetical protein [Planobispora takensis]GII03117.1 hypothetical protein Pta02_51250 [Planobispora takensis]
MSPQPSEQASPEKSEPASLVARVRRELTRAGFVVDPTTLAVDGGLQVRHDPERGVVVAWITAAELTVSDLSHHDHIRSIVHLALSAILSDAGYQVTSDPASGEVIVAHPPAAA